MFELLWLVPAIPFAGALALLLAGRAMPRIGRGAARKTRSTLASAMPYSASTAFRASAMI